MEIWMDSKGRGLIKGRQRRVEKGGRLKVKKKKEEKS